jgi:hypothetical protein
MVWVHSKTAKIVSSTIGALVGVGSLGPFLRSKIHVIFKRRSSNPCKIQNMWPKVMTFKFLNKFLEAKGKKIQKTNGKMSIGYL